jgi:hypothetical protein
MRLIWLLDGGDVGGQGVGVEEVSLLGAARQGRRSCPVAPTGQRDRTVAGVLEPPEHDEPDQVAVVEARAPWGRSRSRG